jgi:hypothetical protein
LKVEKFAEKDEVDGMLGRMEKLVESWDPVKEKQVFRTDDKQITE